MGGVALEVPKAAVDNSKGPLLGSLLLDQLLGRPSHSVGAAGMLNISHMFLLEINQQQLLMSSLTS